MKRWLLIFGLLLTTVASAQVTITVRGRTITVPAVSQDDSVRWATKTDLGTKSAKTITITAGSGLTGGGDLSSNRTLAFDSAAALAFIKSLEAADEDAANKGAANGYCGLDASAWVAKTNNRWRLLFASTAKATVTGTASETSLIGTGSGSVRIAANTLTAGSVIRMRGFGYLTTPASSVATTTLRVKAGATDIVASGAAAPGTSKSGVGWNFEACVIVRTTGATGKVIGEGYAMIPATNTTWGIPAVLNLTTSSTATVDMTADQDMGFTIQLSSGAGTDSYTIENFTLELLIP